MIEARWIFWGFTLQDLVFAAGQFMLLVSAFLLTLKHAVWFARGRNYWERRKWRTLRSACELIIGAGLTFLYVRQIYSGGQSQRLDSIESLVQVWLVAILLITLVTSRKDEEVHPPGPGLASRGKRR